MKTAQEVKTAQRRHHALEPFDFVRHATPLQREPTTAPRTDFTNTSCSTP